MSVLFPVHHWIEIVNGCRTQHKHGSGKLSGVTGAHAQHINALEFIAFFYYLRSKARSKDFHSKRFFHIVDNDVVACVASKGRSNAKILNWIRRLFAGICLATDVYSLALCTISKFNYVDAVSWVHTANHIGSAQTYKLR